MHNKDLDLVLLSSSNMDNNKQPVDEEEPEEQGNSLDWLLGKDSLEIIPAPMDSNVSVSR